MSTLRTLPPLKPGCAREPLPPLTLEDIGPSPPLHNRDLSKGPRVKTRYLGFIMTFKELAQWGEDHDLIPGGQYYRLCNAAWDKITLVVPYPTMTAVAHYGPNRACASSVVVATNRTPEELARATDLEYIEEVRAILGKTGPPVWHHHVNI